VLLFLPLSDGSIGFHAGPRLSIDECINALIH